MVPKGLVLIASALGVAAIAGCQRTPGPVAAAEAPAVPVSQPVQREVTDYVDFTGRTDAVAGGGHPPAGHRLPGQDARSRKGRRSRRATSCSRSTPGPTRPSSTRPRARSTSTRPSSSWPRTTYARDRAIDARVPGGVSQQQLDQDSAAVDEADARVKAYRGQHRGLQAQPRVHQGHLADRRPGQPLLPDARQPGQPGPDAADHGRLARPDVRLLRHGRADPAAHPQGDQRGRDQAGARTAQYPGPHGAAGRGRLPAPGDDQLRQQPGQPRPRAASRCAASSPTPSREDGVAAAVARACSCASACRSASRTRRCWSSTGRSGRTRG